MSTSLLFIAPLLVTLALKVDSLVGIKLAPDRLAVVAGIGALVAMVGNPLFGKMSDRTASRLGMRRPWMVIGLVGGSLGILVVALAPSIPVVLAGWCIAQLFFNALLAAMAAVLPDQVCGLVEAARVTRYLAGESAGQCGPCLNGLPRIANAMTELVSGSRDTTDILRWLTLVTGRGACHHPDGTARFVASALDVFAEEISMHAYSRCSATTRQPFLPAEGKA